MKASIQLIFHLFLISWPLFGPFLAKNSFKSCNSNGMTLLLNTCSIFMKTNKEEVLQKALAVIWEQGYHDTSFQDLSDACGINKSHFFHYFKGGKEDLMTEILQLTHEVYIGMLKRLAETKELSTDEKFQKIKEKLIKMYTANGPGNGCLMANTSLETTGKNYKFTPIVQAFFRDFIHYMAVIYQERHPAEQAQILAEEVVQEIEGAIMLMRVFHDTSYLERALTRANR
jgi:TetR/AcrR family transcriptional regulator, transcriptional repressor for nem operon